MVGRMRGGDSPAGGYRCHDATYPGRAAALHRDRGHTGRLGWLIGGLIAGLVLAMSAGAVPDLRLRFWSTIVPASDKEAVGRAIAATNARVHSPGLPDA